MCMAGNITGIVESDLEQPTHFAKCKFTALAESDLEKSPGLVESEFNTTSGLVVVPGMLEVFKSGGLVMDCLVSVDGSSDSLILVTDFLNGFLAAVTDTRLSIGIILLRLSVKLAVLEE